MTKYLLMHELDVVTYEDVEAETPEKALEAGNFKSRRLCDKCSDEFVMGVPIKTVVLLKGEEVGGTKSFDEDRITYLEREIERLTKELSKALSSKAPNDPRLP